MPISSKVSGLPPEVREWLDKALVEGNFGDYEALADALHTKGFAISKSSLGRYGKNFKERLETLREATHLAREINQACPDDENALGDATMRLVQEHAFKILIELKNEKDTSKQVTLIGKMVASLNKSSLSQKKWMAEVRDKAKKAAEEVSQIAKKGGLSDEAADLIRQKIIGVTS
jgi:hypothetical protein